MKQLCRVVMVIVLCAVSTSARAQDPQEDSYDDEDSTALLDFRSTLDPHGDWVEDADYGTVWIPNEVGPVFAPYVTAGHWVYGDDFVWVSDYDWGWVPFHYGRWVFSDSRGAWAWIPGRQYGPAWVDWRVGDDFVGWAPTAPTYVWRDGEAVPLNDAPDPRFVFARTENLFAPAPAGIVITGPRVAEIRDRTQPFSGGGGGDESGGGRNASAGATGDSSGGGRNASAGGAGGKPAEGNAGGSGGSERAGGRQRPTPQALHVPASKVTHATGHERGVAQAQGFSRPSTAARLGAHPPAGRTRVANAPGARPNPSGARDSRPELGRTAAQGGREENRELPRPAANREMPRAEPGRQFTRPEANREMARPQPGQTPHGGPGPGRAPAASPASHPPIAQRPPVVARGPAPTLRKK